MAKSSFPKLQRLASAFMAHAYYVPLIEHHQGSAMPQAHLAAFVANALYKTDGHPAVIARAQNIAVAGVPFEYFREAVQICTAAANASGRSPESDGLLRHVGEAFSAQGNVSGSYLWNNMVRTLPKTRQSGEKVGQELLLLPLPQ